MSLINIWYVIKKKIGPLGKDSIELNARDCNLFIVAAQGRGRNFFCDQQSTHRHVEQMSTQNLKPVEKVLHCNSVGK